MNASREDNLPEWPYDVNYGMEINVSADVLILGGGLAGSELGRLPPFAGRTILTHAATGCQPWLRPRRLPTT